MQKLFGLIGYPLTHSFSKNYFQQKFVQEGIEDCQFQNFEIENIHQLQHILQQNPALQGFAITIPHKQNILPYLHTKSKEVQLINACNCVCINNGLLAGYNTDVIGFEQSFAPLLQKHHTKALVLGTGGAAQAVKFVLQKLNIQFLNVSRTSNSNTVTYNNLTPEIFAEHLIIINTTPLGTYPAVETFPAIPYKYLTPHHYLYDLVYNPTETVFLQQGKAAGATVKNGYDMLAIQAEANWRLWSNLF